MDEQQLQAARRLLTEAVSRLDRLTGPASASAPTTSSYAAQGSSATDLRAPDRLPPLPTSLERGSEHTDASSRSHIDTARNERLALFRRGSFLAQNYKRSKKNPPVPKSKKKKLSYWQHDFICLAKTGQDKPPSPIEKAELVRANLGHKNLVFF